MKAVICCLNSKYIHSSLAPWCLLAGVKLYSTNIFCKVIEGTINEEISAVAERVLAEKADVVGFCCYIWNITKVKLLASVVKQKSPQTVVVFGGPEVSYNATQVLSEFSDCDYVLSGEGEYPFAMLLNALDKGTEISDVEGLCYRENGKVVEKPPFVSKEQPPSPYTDEYFENLHGRIAYFETSRGCPYSCAFCLSGRCGNARFFDLEKSKELLLKLCNSGTKTVKFVDRTFNANRERAKDLWRFVIENYGKAIPLGVCCHFEIAGDILDDESIELLNSAPIGSIQLEIGMQSFNEQTLKAINRKTDTERLKQNILRLTKPQNIHIHIDLIAGLPFEDLESFRQSFNTAYNLKPNMLQLGFLKLLHGSAMREQPEKFSCTYNATPPYEVTSTPWLSGQDLKEITFVEDALERLYNSGRFEYTLELLLNSIKTSPYMLFKSFAESLPDETVNIPLDKYTEYLYTYFSKAVDKNALRDAIIKDRISSNSTGVLPKFLRVEDENLKKYRRYLNSIPETAEKSGVKRGIAILYFENAVIYADYENQNPVTKKYPFCKLCISSICLDNEK